MAVDFAMAAAEPWPCQSKGAAPETRDDPPTLGTGAGVFSWEC